MWRSAAFFLTAAVLSSCALLGTRQFSLTVPGRDDLDALRVTFVDQTGTVMGLEPAPQGDDLGAFDRGVQPVPGTRNAIIIEWAGGACDEMTIVTLEDRQGSMWVTVKRDGNDKPCILIAIGRRMVIRFYMPVDASRFHVEQ
jgi:hypothetical protein